jgi:hypothetical protein
MAHTLKFFNCWILASFLFFISSGKAQTEKEIELQDISELMLKIGKLPFISQSERYLPPHVSMLKDWEVQANPYFSKEDLSEGNFLREHQKILIPHVEIPLKYVEVVKNKMYPNTQKSLIFKKNGKKWMYWFLNPDDTEFAPALLDELRKRNIPHHYGERFVAYRTSSRSFLVQDPNEPRRVFNIKVSTNKTAGRYKSKGMGSTFAHREKTTTDYVLQSLHNKPLQYLKVLPETGLFVFPGTFPTLFGQAMAVRDLVVDVSSEKQNILVPGFSLFHEENGSWLANIIQKTMSSDPDTSSNLSPSEFWERHFVVPYASALAEFFAYTGLIPSSLHSQNFYLELTPDLKTTGKIILKDFGDVYFAKNAITDKNYAQFIQKEVDFDLKTNKFDIQFHESISLIFAVFQTMEDKMPSWLSREDVDRWRETFYQTFQKIYAERSGKKLFIHYKDALKNITFVNPFVFKYPTYLQCFAVQPLANQAGSILTDELCSQLVKCALFYCHEKRIFSPSHLDFLEGGVDLYRNMEAQYAQCLFAGERHCIGDYHMKKNRCPSVP